jgi:hypothetical protein
MVLDTECFMPSVTYKSFTLIVIILNVIVLSEGLLTLAKFFAKLLATKF